MSLSQKLIEAKINGVECKIKGLKDNMNGVEAKMDDLKRDMVDLKTSMANLKTGLTNFLQDKLTNGEKVVKETHDANKRNVNYYFIHSNVGSKTHHIPKIDMRNFDGNDPTMMGPSPLGVSLYTFKLHFGRYVAVVCAFVFPAFSSW